MDDAGVVLQREQHRLLVHRREHLARRRLHEQRGLRVGAVKARARRRQARRRGLHRRQCVRHLALRQLRHERALRRHELADACVDAVKFCLHTLGRVTSHPLGPTA